MKIGIIGYGKMGNAIGAHLVTCGHDLVAWTRDERKVDASKIATCASTPRQVIDQSGIIISIVANDEATERAHFGMSSWWDCKTST